MKVKNVDCCKENETVDGRQIADEIPTYFTNLGAYLPPSEANNALSTPLALAPNPTPIPSCSGDIHKQYSVLSCWKWILLFQILENSIRENTCRVICEHRLHW